ncbi:MAG TPA: hypothetical protein PLA74_03640, partial [Syntrophales bacterium]|nr:hypothetical protein [Syntrophales bacterium]
GSILSHIDPPEKVTCNHPHDALSFDRKSALSGLEHVHIFITIGLTIAANTEPGHKNIRDY